MNWVLSGLGQRIAAYLERAEHGYEPFTPSNPDALRATLRPAADSRRAAAMPAAPAPTMMTSTSVAGPPGAAPPWPNAGRAAKAAAPARKVRRLRRLTVPGFMVGNWFLRGGAANAIPLQNRILPQFCWFTLRCRQLAAMNRIAMSFD